jgi:hypothetical protein
MLRILLVLTTAWSLFCVAGALESMAPEDAKAIYAWLAKHKEYQLATVEDCNCLEGIGILREGDGKAWKPQPSYQPYYAVGDFDGNGVQDFAVVVRPVSQQEGSQVLVFMRSALGGSNNPISYPVRSKTLEGVALFARPKKTKTALLVGAFSSEAEEIRIPRHR